MTEPLALSLVSHTNAGKTTLARTLLGRDIGEVRDAPHVTEFAEMHELLATPDGERLLLWDTPGFGDSVRLLRRLRQRGNPIGWFLAEVWDRWRDRAFWHGQQALRHVRDQSDVVLYLANAAEPGAPWLAPEMDLLAWMDKPVLVLLNQLGAPRPPDEEAAELQRWRERLAAWPQVKAVLPLDAFARCWVQEGALLQAVADALAADPRPPRLLAAWRAQREATFDAALDELAASLARTAAQRVPVPDAGWLDRKDSAAAAQAALLQALQAEVQASTARLLALHGLQGQAAGTVLARVAALVDVRERIGEGRAALWGGVLTGALAGLKADIASGGLTLGGGLLAGAVLGAIGGAGVARGVNLLRGTGKGHAAWSDAAALPLAEAALLRYLAVAHFGRGRGDWAEGESPPHWAPLVRDALAPQADAWAAAWRGPEPGAALRALLAAAARRVLRQLYPQAVAPAGQ